MRDANGSGHDGVGGAAESKPSDDFAKINTDVNADKTHVSPVDIDAASPASPIPVPSATIEANAPAPAEIAERNLAAALSLAAAGIPVFPARLDWNERTKKWEKCPVIKGRKQTATTDPESIRSWWHDLPWKHGLRADQLVPGIWCGHPALDLVVIDADRHGGPDGVSAFEALANQPEHAIPFGPRTITAGNGMHHIFRQPSGRRKFGNHDGALPSGIDVRGLGGWIVGPGSVRPDGAIWKGWPSLTEVHPDDIPPLPDWLADMLPDPDESKKLRKAKTKRDSKTGVRRTKPASSTGSLSGRNATKREKAYARGALTDIVNELAAMPPSSGRNKLTYRKAFFLGTMVVRGWIDRRTVETELFGACERNGLVADGDDVRGAIERGLNDGSGNPHKDLPDRRTRGARKQRDSSKAWKNLLPTEVYRSLYVQPETRQHATKDAAKDVIAAIEREGYVIDNMDRWQLGQVLGITFDHWKVIGATFGRHPSRFLPCDATQEQIDAHLAAVKETKKPARAKDAWLRRIRAKLARAQQQPPGNDLVAQRCASMVSFARRHPARHRTADLVDGLARAKAFGGITPKTRRNVIDQVLTLALQGKLPALTKFLIVAKEPARNRKITFAIEYRR